MIDLIVGLSDLEIVYAGRVSMSSILAYYLGGIKAEIMGWAHLIFGVVMFVIFLVTGQYMRADFPEKESIPQELRLLMRSRHIYILFSALIHLVLGAYLHRAPTIWRRGVQCAGSAILFVSSVLLLWAFIAETYSYATFSEISRYGIYSSLAGVFLHVVGGLRTARPD